MCTHSIDDLLPHAPLLYAATGEMVKGSYYSIMLANDISKYCVYDNAIMYDCVRSTTYLTCHI